MFKIGEFSKLTNVSIRMLRHYEKLGLLIPDNVDNFTSFRYYSSKQIERAGKIKKLQSLGFSLAIVGDLLESSDPEQIQNIFVSRQRQLEEERLQLEIQASLLSQATEIIKEDSQFMNYNVVIKEIPERKVLSVRGIMPSFEAEGMLWEKVYAQVAEQKVKFAEPSYPIAFFHDEEYKEQDVDVEVQVAVDGDYKSAGEVECRIAPAIQAATVVFSGGYQQMNDVVQAIATWIEANHYRIAGPMFNIYHVSPAMDPNPENWVTEACFMVAPL